MNDSLIRSAVHTKLLQRHWKKPQTLVLDEFGIQHGRARVDIVVINGEIHGYEIKSDVDDLSRLKHQIGYFCSALDRVTCVVGQKLFEKTANTIPNWWGLVLCKQGKRGGVNFQTIRRSKRNPNADLYSIAMLLWRPEAENVLRSIGCEKAILQKSRSIMYTELVNRLPENRLRRIVRENLRNRKGWRDR